MPLYPSKTDQCCKFISDYMGYIIDVDMSTRQHNSGNRGGNIGATRSEPEGTPNAPPRKLKPVKVALLSPIHDIPTLYSNLISEQLRLLLSTQPLISLDVFNRPLMTIPEFQSKLLDGHYDLVMYLGHGNTIGWTDGYLGFLFNRRFYDALKGTIVLTMSCYSARGFGQHCVDHGAIGFIGNTHKVFGAFNTSEHNYGDDFSRPFKNELLNLLNGATISDVVEFAKSEMQSLIDLYRSHLNDWKYARHHVDLMLKNKNFHTFYGDGSARLPKVLLPQLLDISTYKRIRLLRI